MTDNATRSTIEKANPSDLYETLLSVQSAIGDGVVVGDGETSKAVWVNDAFAKMTGYSNDELMSLEEGLNQLAIPEARDELTARLRDDSYETRSPATFETTLVAKDGTTVEIEYAARKVMLDGRPCAVVIVKDVTTKKAVMARIQQASKMEAAGRMAAGIAHDFNNLLTAMKVNCELALEDPHVPGSLRQNLNEIDEAIAIATGLTGRLLDIGRSRSAEPQLLDLKEVIEAMERILHRFVGGEVGFEIVTSEEPLLVNLNKGDLEQVLLNLVINAADATERGAVILVAQQTTLEEKRAKRLRVAPGPYARVSVSDSGTGIRSSDVDRIFDPFFTTKDPAVWTGLGLSTTYSIVCGAGGALDIETLIGAGTRFDVYLPLRSSGDEPAGAPSGPRS